MRKQQPCLEASLFQRGICWSIPVIALSAALLLFSAVASGEMTVKISPSDLSFESGEVISMKTFLQNEGSDAQDISVETDILYPGHAAYGKPVERPVQLLPGQYEVISHTLPVDDTMPAGNYQFVARVKQRGVTLMERFLYFEVKNTLKIFKDIRFEFCLAEGCETPIPAWNNIFNFGRQAIYFKVPGPEFPHLEALLIRPDLREEDLSFIGDMAEIKFSELGPYRVVGKASASGFQTFYFKIPFEVQGRDIPTVEMLFCVVDGLCNGRETEANCPQDCLPEEAIYDELISNADKWLVGQIGLQAMFDVLLR